MDRIRLAIYGKGGIGKSTICSNLAYALASGGTAVTLVGCDPKQDTTMPILHHRQTTLLNIGRGAPEESVSFNDGVACIEVGGPEPGLGCAGRGILSAFGRMGETDGVTIYDVLGDVVCGGFSVPMRPENSDAVLVVTSGEFMSLYAANNILRGLMNFEHDRARAAGLILNCSGIRDEHNIVRGFAKNVGLPIVAVIPRSELFREAESRRTTVSEMFPGSNVADAFKDLAGLILDGPAMFIPTPLDDGQIDTMGRKRETGRGRYVPISRHQVADRRSMMCATIGAAHEAGRIIDLPVIVHGPASCGHIMHQTVERHMVSEFSRNPNKSLEEGTHFFCTDMTEESAVFGGLDSLGQRLEEAYGQGHRIMMVLTTCVSGITGEYADRVSDSFMKNHPGTDVLLVHADGNHSGDVRDGRSLVIDEFVKLIDREVEPSVDALNIIDENFSIMNHGRNSQWLADLLGSMGIGMGTRLFDDCTLESVRRCRENKFTMIFDDTPLNRDMAERIKARNLDILPITVPRGFSETIDWIEDFEDILDKSFDRLVDSVSDDYKRNVKTASARLSGKTVDLTVLPNDRVDWIAECLSDGGADVRRVFVMSSKSGRRMFMTGRADVEVMYGLDPAESLETIRADPPDLVVNTTPADLSVPCMSTPMVWECLTHRASGNLLKYLGNLSSGKGSEGWRNWGAML